jgi:molybdopterin converting factor small subunit
MVTSPQPATLLSCEGATVGQVMACAVDDDTSLATRIREDDTIEAGIFLNGRNVHHLQCLHTPVREGDTLLLPPIPGG